MKYLVALQIKTRFSRQGIGNFLYSPKHQRHVWRNAEHSTPEELAEAVNEALEYVERMDQLNLKVRVFAIESEDHPQNEEFPPIFHTPRKPGRPPGPSKLLRDLQTA